MNLSNLFSKKSEFNPQFLGQNPDEQLIAVTRRGFIIELRWLLPLAIGFYFIILNSYFLDSSLSLVFNPESISFIRLVAFLILSLIFYNRITDWFYSVNLVTTQRVIDFEFSGLGIKKVVETDLRNIQSVTIESAGLLSFLFGLNTIHILTSGDNPNIDLEFISDANKIQDLISDLGRSVNKNERIK